MNYFIYLSFLFALFLQSCADHNQKIKETGKSDTTVLASINKNNFDSSFFSTADFYEYKNDTLSQQAFVHYLSVDKISFLLKSTNKKKNTVCEFSDTAKLQRYPSDPGAYDDELENGELYPAYEFQYTKDTSFVYIGIEPSRGKRLFVTCSNDYNKKCNEYTPFYSAGTLRLKKRSSTPQNGPKLPEIPK